MVLNVRIREEIDNLKEQGKNPLDIIDFLTSKYATGQNVNPVMPSLEQGEEASDFNEIRTSVQSQRKPVCNFCGGIMIETRRSRSNRKLLLCSVCGRTSDPDMDPVTYSTRFVTVDGMKRRRGPTAKSSRIGGSPTSSIIVEEDDKRRNIYSRKSSLYKKDIALDADEKLLQSSSGTTVTDSHTIIPKGLK